MLKKILLAAVIAFCMFHWWANRPVHQPSGMLVKNKPLQEKVDDLNPFNFKNYSIIPLAKFNLKGRVLSKKRYWFGREAALVPYDVAFGWGQMSNNMVLKDISIRQSGRFYFWRSKELPIPEKQIIESSANMHLMAANNDVKSLIKKLRRGNIVSLQGFLVKVDASDGWHWKSSMSRKDSGDGACELIWVEKMKIIEKG
ncbi:MAG: hypothetical protein P9M03_09560 [Candidatus Theseobacter exili]|nr:hypothetical protein [Candidatus Theseobacter exili]